jgi:hypothetical protein
MILISRGFAPTYLVAASRSVVEMSVLVWLTLSAVYHRGLFLALFFFSSTLLTFKSIVTARGLSVNLYADDSQLYGSCRPGCSAALSSSLPFCSNSVSEWMRSKRPQLNADKTDVIWCPSAHRISSLSSAHTCQHCWVWCPSCIHCPQPGRVGWLILAQLHMFSW